MGLEPITFVKNWYERTQTREENWDEIANKTSAYSLRTNNNLKQIGLDLNGSSYEFNNVGRATQTTSVVSRITTLENTSAIVGTRNLGLDLSSANKIKVVGSDGSNLSSTNKGVVVFNETTDAGDLVTREITANMEVTLTGAHWGNDTYGDLTDYVLWVLFLDTGSSAILGVAAQGGRQSISNTLCFTAVGSVTAINHVLVSSAPSSTYNATYMGWVKADFDDTGNPGGENYWTVQSSVGDVNIGPVQTYFEGTVVF